MVYISSLLLVVGLFFVESSMLPHFLSGIMTPLLVLPFISILVLKDRTLFPIILAGVLGMLTDAVAGNYIPVYSIAYLLVIFTSKVFFNRFISYGEFRANIINVFMAITIIYGTEIALTLENINNADWILPLLLNIVLTFAFLFLYMRFGRKYFSWIEKETEERYR